MTLIGFDFSINKPAACVLHKNKYYFISWPYGLKEEIIKTYINAGVEIIGRKDDKEKGETLSSKMRYEVENAKYLSNLIAGSLFPYLNIDTFIAFEGLSYASSGDVVLQLGGYKYMLMSKLSEVVPLKNMFTYSPITIKSIAGCAKRGMGKTEMINEFIKSGPLCKFRLTLFEKPELFQSIKAKNWIIHLDDLVDAYWTLMTLREKESL
jgi:hypothetical protein